MQKYLKEQYMNIGKEQYELLLQSFPSFIIDIINKYQDLLPSSVHNQTNFIKMTYLYDYFAVLECLDNLDEKYHSDFFSLDNFIHYIFNTFLNQQVSRNETKAMRLQIQEYLKKSTEEKEFTFHLISVHDSTLYFFLKSFGLQDVSFAPYGSTVIIEVFELNNQFYCRLSFNSQIQRVWNDEKICLLNEFISLLNYLSFSVYFLLI